MVVESYILVEVAVNSIKLVHGFYNRKHAVLVVGLAGCIQRIRVFNDKIKFPF